MFFSRWNYSAAKTEQERREGEKNWKKSLYAYHYVQPWRTEHATIKTQFIKIIYGLVISTVDYLTHIATCVRVCVCLHWILYKLRQLRKTSLIRYGHCNTHFSGINSTKPSHQVPMNQRTTLSGRRKCEILRKHFRFARWKHKNGA